MKGVIKVGSLNHINFKKGYYLKKNKKKRWQILRF